MSEPDNIVVSEGVGNAIAAVPEPATVTLSAMAFAVLLLRVGVKRRSAATAARFA